MPNLILKSGVQYLWANTETKQWGKEAQSYIKKIATQANKTE